MRMKTHFLIPLMGVSAIFCFSPALSRALDLGFAKEDGGQPGSFLDFGVSARSLSMGNAHTGFADDASATYWNPAGLSYLDRKNFVGLYSNLYEDTGFGAVSYAQPTLRRGTFGFSYVSLTSDNFVKRNQPGEDLGRFDNSQTALLFSYGVPLSRGIAIGSTLKSIRHKIDVFSDSDFGADVGVMIRGKSWWQVGIQGRNIISPKIKLDTNEERYPQQFRLGLKVQPWKSFLIAVDGSQFERALYKVNLGFEYNWQNTLFLRSGINENEITTGLGFKIGEFGIDYAFGYNDSVPGINDLGGSHRVGFHLEFGQNMSEEGQKQKWNSKGKKILWALTKSMNRDENPNTEKMKKKLAEAGEVIRHHGIPQAHDLYTVQGYVYYFKRDLKKSIHYLTEAASLDPKNPLLIQHIEKVQNQMEEADKHAFIEMELKKVKESYKKDDFKETIRICKKILSLYPEQVDAQTYKEDATQRINEPINRSLKIGKKKYEKADYLGAIKSMGLVLRRVPDNEKAEKYIQLSIEALEKMALIRNGNGKRKLRVVYKIGPKERHSRLLYSQGLKLYAKGRVEESLEKWKHAMEMDERNRLALNAYDRALLELEE